MELGAFSVSLAVQDIEQSKRFYEKLGFSIVAGDQAQNWLIMRNGDHTIGLFQGMFESNILTFNPGWDKSGQKLDKFPDVRELYYEFKAKGVEIANASINNNSGPSSFSVVDPDGNAILIDQHV